MALVLVVDDDRTYRQTVARGLELAGYTVVEAQDGIEALALLSQRDPDAMVIDIVMPRKDGLDVIVEARTLGLKTKIVAMSARGRYHKNVYLELLKTIGTHEALLKPFPMEDLLQALDKQLSADGLPPKTAVSKTRGSSGGDPAAGGIGTGLIGQQADIDLRFDGARYHAIALNPKGRDWLVVAGVRLSLSIAEARELRAAMRAEGIRFLIEGSPEPHAPPAGKKAG